MKHTNEINNMQTSNSGRFFSRLGGLALLASIALAGCGGGASTTSQIPQAGTTTSSESTAFFNSSGGSDLDRFRDNLWRNINATSRCGNCHTPGGNAASHPFANASDVNAAYSTITQSDASSSNRYINRTTPSASGIVTKFSGAGHFCWQATQAACATDLTTWITAWIQPTGTTGTTISLTAPTDEAISGGKFFPATAPGNYSGVHTILMARCANCHVPNVQQAQQPYFAVASAQASYDAVVSNAKINLNATSQSRLYRRLVDDNHNCWTTSCANDGAAMLAAIDAMANGITAITQEAGTVVSRVVDLSDGISVSLGSRIDANAIAVYDFKEGTGAVINDTSGVGAPTNLSLQGVQGTDYQWLPNWGIRFLTPTGRAQATDSSKIHSGIISANAYTIEAWVIPSNVTQQDANIVSFSASGAERNFALAQYQTRYQSFNRSNNPAIPTAQKTTGEPVLETNDDDNDALATLQHVVVTYSAAAGRRIYVNGRYTEDTDPVSGASLGNWLTGGGYQLMFGSEGGARPWAGTLRKVVIHRAALTEAEVQQNFSASVGQKYILMFNVSGLGGFPAGSYVHAQVEEFDGFSYLFYKPTLINLNSTVPTALAIRGIRVGVNARESAIGQVFAGVNATIGSTYLAGTGPDSGQVLSYLGAVIPKENGPTLDKFFLSFETIGSQVATKDYNPPLTGAALIPPALNPSAVSDVALHTFEEISASMSELTGINRTRVATTFNRIFQQLPPTEAITGFVPSHQTGITELAINYCNQLAGDTTRTTYFPSVNFGGMSFATDANRDAVIDPLLDRLLNVTSGTPTNQPSATAVRTELRSLIGTLSTSCAGACSGPRTVEIVTATCAAAISSAAMLLQ